MLRGSGKVEKAGACRSGTRKGRRKSAGAGRQGKGGQREWRVHGGDTLFGRTAEVAGVSPRAALTPCASLARAKSGNGHGSRASVVADLPTASGPFARTWPERHANDLPNYFTNCWRYICLWQTSGAHAPVSAWWLRGVLGSPAAGWVRLGGRDTLMWGTQRPEVTDMETTAGRTA